MKKLLLALLAGASILSALGQSTTSGWPGLQAGTSNPQTGTYQVLAADFANCRTIPVASGTFTITLVASSSQPANGQCLNIINFGTGVVTVARSGQNINGGTSSLTIPAGSATAPTGAGIVSDGTNYEAVLWGGGSSSGVTSFSGDGSFASNSSSTGGVTLALNTVSAHKYWGNNSGSTAAGAYDSIALADLPQLFVTNAETATYQVLAADFAACKTITVASGTFTVTLVASGSQPASGQCINVINYGTGVVTIARSGQNINGGTASITLNAGSAAAPTSAYVVSDGTNYEATIDEGTTGTVTNAATLTNKGVAIGNGANGISTIDFPERLFIPAANCNNGTAGAGWSIGASGTVTCRAGTNNLGGYVSITDTSSTFAQFAVTIPEDWDTGTDPYIRFQLSYPGTDGSSSHTIIPQIKVSCAKGDGSTSDDVTFNAAHSSSTITLSSATANLFFVGSNVQMNSTDVTGCVAGSLMIVQVGRATDTATSAANFYGATITFPRLITVQAN